MKYTDVLSLTAKRTSKVGVYETVQMAIKNRDTLDKVSKAVKEISFNDIKQFNLIRKLIRSGDITKVGQVYMFDNTELGVDVHAIAKFLKVKANKEIAVKLLKNE